MMIFIMLLIALVPLVGYFLGRNKAKNARQMKRYDVMPASPIVEENTELDPLSDGFYCMYRGKDKNCISGYMPKKSKE
jgi:hypothetical protein